MRCRGDTGAVKVDRIDLTGRSIAMFGTVPRNVDLPWSGEHLLVASPSGYRVLLRLQDGDPFLVSVERGRQGLPLRSTALLRGGNFTRHALFVTSLLRMAELSRPMGDRTIPRGAGAHPAGHPASQGR